MDHIIGLKCSICGKLYQPGEVEYICPEHGDNGNLDVVYDYERVKARWRDYEAGAQTGMWRYKPLLPVELTAVAPPLLVGDTPLYRADNVAHKVGVSQVWIKDDGRNPTASLKDRASALVVARAMAEGREIITTASTGNAGAALAGLAASVQLPNVIFAPATAPEAKIAQLLVYGSRVILVEGTYDDAFDLCLQATQAYGWYCRNTGYNPYTAEGKKTVSYEICEQLFGQRGQFDAPDTIIVSVGDGNIISGVHKGLKDLLALGWISHMPRLVGVQAEGSAAMCQAWKAGIDPVTMPPIEANTIADSISAGLPRDRVKAMNAVKETGGFFMTVSDQEILSAIPSLARASGIFAEPAASAGYAGLLKCAQESAFRSNERIVVLVTGNGLKDIASARRSVEQAHRITPRLEEVERIVSEIFRA